MQPLGWLIMILAVGGVTALFAWCVWRVLSPDTGPNSNPKSQ